MNPHDTERLLRDTLAERAESTEYAPTSIDHVRQRARFSRRRQNLMIGTAAAATVTILAGSFALLGHDEPRSVPPSLDPTSSVTRTVVTHEPEPTQSTPPPQPSEAIERTEADGLRVTGLSVGQAPRIAWAEGADVHLADGSTLTGVLPADTREFAPMGSGVMAAYDSRVSFINADGTPGPRTYPLDGGLATSPEGKVVAWAGPDRRVTVVQAEGDERYTLNPIPGEGPLDAVSVSSEDCVEGRTTDAGCAVIVNILGAEPATYSTSSHGIVDRLNGSFKTTTATRWPLAAGITQVTDQGTCSQLVTENDWREPDWGTCAFRLVEFSPDGRHIFAVGSYADGLGDGDAAIVTSDTAELMAHRQSEADDQATIMDYAWEDDEHVLLTIFSKGQWSIVRMGLDGQMEYAVAPRAADEFSPPFRLRS
ncbi:MAG: hypothetical protein V9G04_03020 [Nocardioides sp.]